MGQQQGQQRQGQQQGRRKLPISVQTFREVRESGCYYVDKTAYIERLASGGKCYFLSRPRRFGKSLLLDTIKEAFKGSRELFGGLAIGDRWDWSERRPVVRLDFTTGLYKEPEGLQSDLSDQLEEIAHSAGLALSGGSAPAGLRRLIAELHQSTGRRVVVLVDEYDKPILDALEAPEVAAANRDLLRGVYSCLKFADAHIEFAFLTGVSKFSKVNLFSGLNNLIDITLEPEFSSICGYTDDDLDTVFAAELDGLDRDRIREWYNGYSWLGDEKVYNPYDVLLLFRKRTFGAYWCETGTPKFLVDMLIERGVPTASLGGTVAGSKLLSALDVDHIATEALLFQAGYLTIVSQRTLGGRTLYRLDYPNLEVRMAFNDVMLDALAQHPADKEENNSRLVELLEAGDAQGLRGLFHRFYASIPHQWYTNNTIARFEGYYASVFYSYFAGLELDITVEDSSSHGRLDMAVRHAGSVFLFEFKVAGASPPGPPLDQMTARGYADKYRGTGEPIHLIGVVFDPEDRNIVAFETAQA